MNKSLLSLSAVIALSSWAQAAGVYSNDFNAGTPGPEWSNTTTTVAPLGQRYLGQFGNGTVSLNLGSLPAGLYTLDFDFYAIQSQDGNGPAGGGPDNFQFLANGTNLFFTNFDNFGASGQAYPNQLAPFGPGGSNTPGTGATATDTLGYTFGGSRFGDATYHFSLAYSHAGGNLAFDFVSFQGQGVGDEGWGIDNVLVVPSPASAAAMLVLAGVARRRR